MAEFPGVIYVRDLCHLYNLICEEAVKAFSKYIVDFIQKLCSHFNTGLRANVLEEKQRSMDIKEPLKILRFKDIR